MSYSNLLWCRMHLAGIKDPENYSETKEWKEYSEYMLQEEIKVVYGGQQHLRLKEILTKRKKREEKRRKIKEQRRKRKVQREERLARSKYWGEKVEEGKVEFVKKEKSPQLLYYQSKYKDIGEFLRGISMESIENPKRGLGLSFGPFDGAGRGNLPKHVKGRAFHLDPYVDTFEHDEYVAPAGGDWHYINPRDKVFIEH